MSTDTGPSLTDDRLGAAYRARLRRHGAQDHPGEADWEAYASVAMDGEARARLADHVVVCELCREVYDAVRVLMEEAPAIDAEAPTGGRVTPRRQWWRYASALALAASLLLVVAAAAVYLTSRGGEPVHVTTDATTPVAPTQLEPAASLAPAYRLAMVTPDVRLPADLIVTSRGAAGVDARQFLERFGDAIAPYRQGRFDEAAARLGRLSAIDGDVPEVWFYLGVSHLFAGRPEDALKAFDRPGVAAAGGDDLQWSRAVAIEWLGRARETDAVLRALCAGAGPHRDRACAALRAGEAPLPQAR
jgi:hypothetical protein